MILKDIMTKDVQGLDRNESTQSAAKLMAEMDVGAIPVFEDGRPVGIVTDRDIVVRGVAPGKDGGSTPIAEVMTGDLVMLAEDTAIEEAAEQMERKQIRRLLVHGPDHEVVGIVSLGDLATKVPGERTCGEVIEQVSKPRQPARA